MTRIAAALFLTMAFATQATAQASPPDTENGRFRFNQVLDGFLRLDTRTGEVSQCTRKIAGGWACRSVPDERAALEGEIARLQSENSRLQKDNGDLAARLAARTGPPAPDTARRPDTNRDELLRLPSDAELDRMVGFMEKVWRRLIEMVQRTHRDLDKKT